MIFLSVSFSTNAAFVVENGSFGCGAAGKRAPGAGARLVEKHTKLLPFEEGDYTLLLSSWATTSITPTHRTSASTSAPSRLAVCERGL